MGAMLSLPVVGYLLMPSLTSYSTSINILFFYMVRDLANSNADLHPMPLSSLADANGCADMEYTCSQPASPESRSRRHTRNSGLILPSPLATISPLRLYYPEFGRRDEDAGFCCAADKDRRGAGKEERLRGPFRTASDWIEFGQYLLGGCDTVRGGVAVYGSAAYTKRVES